MEPKEWNRIISSNLNHGAKFSWKNFVERTFVLHISPLVFVVLDRLIMPFEEKQ